MGEKYFTLEEIGLGSCMRPAGTEQPLRHFVHRAVVEMCCAGFYDT